jgi:hypothetical protein
MIQTVKTEAGYRAVQLDSSSSLKDFSFDRRKYYKKYILNTKVEEKSNAAINMGHMVETLLLEPDRFDEKFFVSSCVNIPTGLMLSFVEELFKETESATNDDGEVTATFEALSLEAYKKSGFKIAYDAVIKKFAESNAVVYFEELCTVRTNNLTVITPNDIDNAQKIVDELNDNPITKNIFRATTNEHFTVYDQYQVEGYIVHNHVFKSMMDRVIISHREKTIQVYDLKCTWTVENFYSEYYLYRRAYIQAYLYYHACIYIRDTTPEYKDYTVLPPKFVVCDSINYYSPLVYVLNEEDLSDAYNGFTVKGKNYPGVKSIIEDLNWAIENDTWNISRTAHSCNGLINIKHEY